MNSSTFLGSLWFSQLWQVTLLLVFVVVVNVMLRKRRPHLATLLWLVLLVKCITPPIFSSPSSVFSWVQPVQTLQYSRDSNSDWFDTTASPDPSMLLEYLINGETRQEIALDENALNQFAPRLSSTEQKLIPTLTEKRKVSSSSTGPEWRAICLTIWLVGGVSLFSLALVRYAMFRRRLRSTSFRDPNLELLTCRLANVLRIKRRVQVWVTDSKVGPAIIGIFRPVIVLPRVIVERQTTHQLEPVIAHEMNHLRRGDIWFGGMQLLVTCLWWFHPLIWLVNRAITRDIERCCDESTIAIMKYRPAEYARCLIDVLQLKHLKPVPSFPGVRRIDITKNRLERIMNLRQGSQLQPARHASFWYWIAAIVIAMITIPGGAFASLQQDESSGKKVDEKTQSTPLKVPVVPGFRLPVAGVPSNSQEIKNLDTELFAERTFNVDGAFERYSNEFYPESPKEARDSFIPFLKERLTNFDKVQLFYRMPAAWTDKGAKQGQVVKLTPVEAPQISWRGDHVYVRHTRQMLDQVEQTIKLVESNLDHYIVRIVLLEISEQLARKIGATETTAEMVRRVSQQSGTPMPAMSPEGAAQVIGKTTTIRDARQIDRIARDLATKHDSVRILSSPRLTTMAQLPAIVQVGAQVPIQDVVDGVPKLVVKDIGIKTKVLIRPSENDPNQVTMFLDVESSRLAKRGLIQKASFVENETIVVPQIHTSQMQTTIQAGQGDLVILGTGTVSHDDNENKRTLAMIAFERFSQSELRPDSPGREPSKRKQPVDDFLKTFHELRKEATDKKKEKKVQLIARTYFVGDLLKTYEEMVESQVEELPADMSLSDLLVSNFKDWVASEGNPDPSVSYYADGKSIIAMLPRDGHENAVAMMADLRLRFSHVTGFELRSIKSAPGAKIPDAVLGKPISPSEMALLEQVLATDNFTHEQTPTIRSSFLTAMQSTDSIKKPLEFLTAEQQQSPSNDFQGFSLDLDSQCPSEGPDTIDNESFSIFTANMKLFRNGKTVHESFQCENGTVVLIDVTPLFADHLNPGESMYYQMTTKIKFDRKAFDAAKKIFESQKVNANEVRYLPPVQEGELKSKTKRAYR